MAVSNMDPNQETVYRTVDDSHVVMSEKVQSLAGSVYQEFEKMIGKYDHDVVKELMPLVVNVLECLDTAYTENQEHEVELELLREDNEQLVTQYEREKQLRKGAEQKLLEVEDVVEDERKDLSSKIESLESIVRMLELKAKNSTDHVFRLEEKETESKKEYTKLHERYTELFKTHMDYMERTKMMLSTNERLEAPARAPRMPSLGLGHLNRSSGPVSFGFASLEEVRPEESLMSDDMGGSPHDSTASNTSLRNEINEVEDVLGEKKGPWSNQSSKLHSPDAEATLLVGGRSTTNREQRSGNTLYQELSFQETMGDPEDGDVTGSWVHPGEYASSGWKSLRVGSYARELKPANDNFFGMGKEVENLIMENNELLATKNALNIVKDDLILKVDELTSEQEVLREEMTALHAIKDRLKQKTAELEEELKRVKEEAAKTPKGGKSDDEDEDVPMAQRKRFTRVEMARVLMERNQYKERLLELQEAVRWREAIRASRSDVAYDSTKSRGVWNYFSGLFRAKSEKEVLGRKGPSVGVHFSPNHVTPALTSGASSGGAAGERKRPVDYLDRGPVCSEKVAARRALERREQYRQVRAHVRKEDGRLQAYGWSLPARQPAPAPDRGHFPAPDPARGHVPVPVPVFCQPLATSEQGAQVWCAAGVNLAGGRTRDGGCIVGGSVFYGAPPTSTSIQRVSASTTDDEPHITRLEEELLEGEKVRAEGETLEQRLSSQVWICSSTRSESRAAVLDATDPQRALEAFPVCPSYVLCVASVPGATEADYRDGDDGGDEGGEGAGTGVMEGTEGEAPPGRVRFVRTEVEEEVTNEQDTEFNVLRSSVLPTMWLGAQNGYLYMHSAVTERATALAAVRMPDSVLCITHCAGRVLVALANGTVAVFRRKGDAQWNLSQYHTVDLGDAQASVRCMSLVHATVWCGYKNKIHVLDPIHLLLKTSVEAHPRKESQVRQLAWLGDGVWVSIRLDSTLRLYHAHTYQHLQDVDIEPYVSKMLGTGKLGFSFVRITALLVSTGRLWIGTGEGVVISVPLSEDAGTSGAMATPAVRVYTDALTEKLTPSSFIPYCSMSEAQLSFHGHREAVKFFIAVPGPKSTATNPHMLVMSGGEGYVDFRTGQGDGAEDDGGTIPEEPESDGVAAEYDSGRRRADMSHLIIWQVALAGAT